MRKRSQIWVAGVLWLASACFAHAQTTTAFVVSEPCVGFEAASMESFEAGMRALEATAADLRKRQAAVDPDTAATEQLAARLKDVQERLLDLLFARECKRTDFEVNFLAPVDKTPPPWV